jgi:hypothetical protein
VGSSLKKKLILSFVNEKYLQSCKKFDEMKNQNKIKWHILGVVCCIVLWQMPAFGQANFRWVQQVEMPNYELPKSQLHVISPNQIVVAVPDSHVQAHGIRTFGRVQVQVRNAATGLRETNFTLGTHVIIESLGSDLNGNIYMGGSFMQALSLNGRDTLANTGTGLTINQFLVCINAAGQLVWKRNLTADDATISRFSAIRTDRSGNVWYAVEQFRQAKIVKLNANGTDGVSRAINGAQAFGYFDFDTQNNLYFTGAVGSPTALVFGGLSTSVSRFYGLFLAKMNSNGVGQWVSQHNDITFQRPNIAVARDGNVYWGGEVSDTISFGNISFPRVQNPNSFFIVKTSPTGAHVWAKQSPTTTPYTGKFTLGTMHTLTTDDSSNLYVGGQVWGKVDWGNNVVSNPTATTTSRQMGCTKFSPNGTPQWTITGGSSSSAPHAFAADRNGNVYFSMACNAKGTFGQFSTNAAAHNSVVGCISPTLSL